MTELCYFDPARGEQRMMYNLGCRGRNNSRSDVEKLIPEYIERKRQYKQKQKAANETRREYIEEKRRRSLEAAIRAANDGGPKQNAMRKEYHLMRTSMTKYIKEEAPKLKSNYYMSPNASSGFWTKAAAIKYNAKVAIVPERYRRVAYWCECSTCSKIDKIVRQELIEGIKERIENNIIWLEMYTIDVIPLPEKEEVKPKVQWCGRCRSQHEMPQCDFIALPRSEGGHIPDMMYK